MNCFPIIAAAFEPSRTRVGCNQKPILKSPICKVVLFFLIRHFFLVCRWRPALNSKFNLAFTQSARNYSFCNCKNVKFRWIKRLCKIAVLGKLGMLVHCHSHQKAASSADIPSSSLL